MFGKVIYFTGENRRAAWAAGFPLPGSSPGPLPSLASAAAADGILLGAFNTTATTAIGNSYTYNALAATLVAGTLISGGRGSVWRTFLGATFIAALTNLLLLRGYSTGIQILVEGVVVFLVVIVVHLVTRTSR